MLWGAAALVCVALAIWGKHPERRVVHLVAKPLATLMLVAAVLAAPRASPWLLAGLTLSLVGDALLMFEAGFLPGLGAFLAALIVYSIGFSADAPAAPVYLLLPGVVALFVLRWLWPRLGRMRLPVTLYVAAMVLMVWRAFARFEVAGVSREAAVALAAGALLFMAGDTLLAARRFRERPAPYAVELGTYYLAQGCIALSAWL